VVIAEHEPDLPSASHPLGQDFVHAQPPDVGLVRVGCLHDGVHDPDSAPRDGYPSSGDRLSLSAGTAPIVGATKPHHLTDAVAALDMTLTDQEITALEEHYTPRKPT
jgi:hypothetical protein